MKLRQISVRLDDEPGRLYEVAESLGRAGVNIYSLTVAESPLVGVFRMIVAEPAEARRVLSRMGVTSYVDEVVVCAIPDTPGSLARMLKPISEEMIDVEYLYAVSSGNLGRAVVIVKFSDNDEALEILHTLGKAPPHIEGFFRQKLE
jgi:hypothetical protein